jgi:hypothetical protein
MGKQAFCMSGYEAEWAVHGFYSLGTTLLQEVKHVNHMCVLMDLIVFGVALNELTFSRYTLFLLRSSAQKGLYVTYTGQRGTRLASKGFTIIDLIPILT